MGNANLITVLDRPDQERVRADLAVFFGPRAQAYLDTYERMRSASGWRRLQPIGWSWSAFSCGFAWFFYRKMYVLGAIAMAVPIVLGFAVDAGASSVAVVFALLAKGWYVQSGLKRILEADELDLVGRERTAYLRLTGGVSVGAGAIAGIVYGGVLASLIFSAVLMPSG